MDRVSSQISPAGNRTRGCLDEDVDVRAENVYLKALLLDLSHQHSKQSKLVERLLYIGPVTLQNPQMVTDEEANNAQLQHKESGLVAPNCTCTSTPTKCAEEKNTEEKVDHCGKCDLEQEAYPREMMDRILWLESQLMETKKKQPSKGEDDKVFQMKEYYENLLEKSKNALDDLRLCLDVTQRDLTVSQKWCLKTEKEVDTLKRQLRTQKIYYETETTKLQEMTEELCAEIERERCRSAELEQQMKMISLRPEEEKEDSPSLKSKLINVVKVLKRHDTNKTTL